MPERNTIEEVNRLSEPEFVARFGSLFESSPRFVEEVWGRRPFTSLSGLHEAFLSALYDAPPERRVSLIQAHPDLAGKAAVAGDLTPESRGEQASAGLNRLSPEEYEQFDRLNVAYKEKFGFPLIFAVREYTKDGILAGAETRLGHSRSEEIETALAEIGRIAYLRLRDLVEPDLEGGDGAGASGRGSDPSGRNRRGER